MSRPSAANSKLATLLSVVAFGPEVIVTGGARPSTFQLHSAGVGSTLPSASFARTAKSCSPKIKLSYVTGELHGAKLPASAASSRAHSNVTPGRFETKVKVAVVLSVGSAGRLTIALSGIGLTVQL